MLCIWKIDRRYQLPNASNEQNATFAGKIVYCHSIMPRAQFNIHNHNQFNIELENLSLCRHASHTNSLQSGGSRFVRVQQK